MNWSKAIKIARAARGVTQKELSKLVDINQSYLSLIESGRRIPSTDVLERIAKVTGFPVPLLTIMASPKEDFDKLGDETRAIMGGWFLNALIGKTLEDPSVS